MKMYDILIIGAGPAGSNLARLLSKDKSNPYKVGLIDKRRLDKPVDPLRQKACGGLLSPDAQKMLAKLDLNIPSDILENPQIFKVRTIDFDNSLERYYQRYYYNMDREKFDRYLFSLIPDEVEKHLGEVVGAIHINDDHWEIHINQSKTILKSKFLVAADGANSFVRRTVLGEYAGPEKYISIQKWYPVSSTTPYYTGIFDSEITDYYSWTIQKGNRLILGTALPLSGPHAVTPKERLAKFDLLREKTADYLGISLETEVKTEGAFLERSTSVRQLRFASRLGLSTGKKLSLALLGEAAGATSPTSAEGFSYALDTSLKLYESLTHGLESAELRYELSCDSIRRNIFLKNLKSPAMYSKNIRKLVMKSGIGSLKDLNKRGQVQIGT
ncbi:MAG: FAD-binding protein [Bacillota bacterium]|nr:FAD-binding protein [Bacillota bacterium]